MTDEEKAKKLHDEFKKRLGFRYYLLYPFAWCAAQILRHPFQSLFLHAVTLTLLYFKP